jgi:hypothetical protein
MASINPSPASWRRPDVDWDKALKIASDGVHSEENSPLTVGNWLAKQVWFVKHCNVGASNYRL